MQTQLSGERFAAAVSTGVLTVVLITGAGWLLAAQAVVFGVGALLGIDRSPYGWAYRALTRDNSRPVPPGHDARGVRFAQRAAFALAVVGTIGYLEGEAWIGSTVTAFIMAGTFPLALVGWCLGCEVYGRLTH